MNKNKVKNYLQKIEDKIVYRGGLFVNWIIFKSIQIIAWPNMYSTTFSGKSF